MDKYDVNDPATYECRFVIREKATGRFLCRGSFGYGWYAEFPEAEFFSRGQARCLMAGKFPGYLWRGEDAEIVDSATMDAERG